MGHCSTRSPRPGWGASAALSCLAACLAGIADVVPDPAATYCGFAWLALLLTAVYLLPEGRRR